MYAHQDAHNRCKKAVAIMQQPFRLSKNYITIQLGELSEGNPPLT